MFGNITLIKNMYCRNFDFLKLNQTNDRLISVSPKNASHEWPHVFSIILFLS